MEPKSRIVNRKPRREDENLAERLERACYGIQKWEKAEYTEQSKDHDQGDIPAHAPVPALEFPAHQLLFYITE